MEKSEVMVSFRFSSEFFVPCSTISTLKSMLEYRNKHLQYTTGKHENNSYIFHSNLLYFMDCYQLQVPLNFFIDHIVNNYITTQCI